jgi:imidazolonepropionase-like amidohydrolase
MHDAGIPIVAGTDSIAGFFLHRELEDYVTAGLSAPDALRAATLTPARVMHRDKDLGTIAPRQARRPHPGRRRPRHPHRRPHHPGRSDV